MGGPRKTDEQALREIGQFAANPDNLSYSNKNRLSGRLRYLRRLARGRVGENGLPYFRHGTWQKMLKEEFNAAAPGDRNKAASFGIANMSLAEVLALTERLAQDARNARPGSKEKVRQLTPKQTTILNAAKKKLEKGEFFNARELALELGAPHPAVKRMLTLLRNRRELPPVEYRKKPAITPRGTDEWKEQMERHRPWAVYRAKNGAPGGLSLEERIAAAEDGLGRGLELFKPGQGASITTFTRPHIDGAIGKESKEAEAVSRMLPLDAPLPGNNGSRYDKLKGAEPAPRPQHTWEEMLERMMNMHRRRPGTRKHLTEPQLLTFLLRVHHGLTLAQAGHALGISKQGAGLLQESALRKIREEIRLNER